MKRNLFIYGSGGLGREIAELAGTLGKWNLAFIDDDPALIGKTFEGIEVVGTGEFLHSVIEPADLVFGIASPQVKHKLSDKFRRDVFSFPAVIHPTAVAASSAQIAEGAVIFNGCFVSVNTSVGRHTLLSAGTQLAHDSNLGDFSSVMPSVNICGNVEIEDRVYIGVQSAIRQGLRIGSSSVIGMGSVVVKDVPENCTVMGNPARVCPKM